MDRREKIRLTLERIKVTKALVQRLEEFVAIARNAGHEPVHSLRTLERVEGELTRLRASLFRLTTASQAEFARQAKPLPAQRAA